MINKIIVFGIGSCFLIMGICFIGSLFYNGFSYDDLMFSGVGLIWVILGTSLLFLDTNSEELK